MDTLLSPVQSKNFTLKSMLFMPAGALVTLVLFYGMANLIQQGPLTSAAVLPPIDIGLMDPPKQSEVIEKVKLPPPPPVVQAPPPRAIIPTDGGGEGLPTDIQTAPPVIDLGPATQAVGGRIDRGATPIVRINPKYPPVAARDGIAGWVKLSFTINEMGQVEDVVVIDAEPKRMFEKEAVRALKGWKYQPQVENGVAIKQTGMQVQLDFNLENEA